jgi:hypothetical protein
MLAPMSRALTLVLLLASAVAADPRPPLPAITARALKTEVTGPRVRVTAGAGAIHGVTRKATCAFVDATGTTVSTDCVVIHVELAVTIVSTQLSLTSINEHPTIRFVMQ